MPKPTGKCQRGIVRIATPTSAEMKPVRPRRWSIESDSNMTANTPDLRTDDYDTMLKQLDGAIDELTEKIESGRIRDPERDKVRLKQYRTLGYLIRTKRKVLEDTTLQELEQRLAKLEDGDTNEYRLD